MSGMVGALRDSHSFSAHETRDSEDRLQAFQRHRDLLFSIAYRMLASVADAEDMLQETFIRWQQSSQTDVDSPRAFLVTIISRLCIQQLESARVRREQYVGQWLPEPIFTGRRSDPSESFRMDESLSMAFLLLLEKLAPAERAAFLLHEVFDYEYPEVAKILDKSEVHCRQLLRRARQRITQRRPRFEASPESHKRLLDGFLSASTSGDLSGLVTLLSNDVVLHSDGGGRASAALNPICGRDRVIRFLAGATKKTVPANVTTAFEEINGQPSLVYRTPSGNAGCVVSFDVIGGLIQNIYVVTNPEKLARLPKLTSESSTSSTR
jgi:RNA polymerase sigma-70 factor, ECF subfamily